MRLVILICMVLIFALGLMMVFNTSSAEILDRWLDKDVHHALLRQIAYGLIGVLLALWVWKIGALHLVRLAPYLLIAATLALILVFVPGVGKSVNGARRWLGVGSLTLQPSEFVKYLIPMTFIEWTLRQKGPVGFFSFCRIVFLLFIPLGLVLIEPDNGTAAVMLASLVPLFFISKVPLKFWVLPITILAVLAVVAAIQLPYVRGRLQVYLHPEKDLLGKGHQPYQAKIAAGSGGLFGRGPGASLQKLTYLPEAQNDYIAAIYAEEFGFAGILLLIVLYMLFTYGGFSIAMQSKEDVGSYLASSITFLIALQAFLNLGVVSGLLPSKGVNLPFFSQGGSSLIANIVGLTLLLTIDEKKSDTQRRRDRRPSLSSPGVS